MICMATILLLASTLDSSTVNASAQCNFPLVVYRRIGHVYRGRNPHWSAIKLALIRWPRALPLVAVLFLHGKWVGHIFLAVSQKSRVPVGRNLNDGVSVGCRPVSWLTVDISQTNWYWKLWWEILWNNSKESHKRTSFEATLIHIL